MGKVAKYLNQLTIGNVFDTPDVLEAYATDCSVLRIKPKLVAFPESTEDIRKIMRFCYQLSLKDIKIPVTVRGSGLDEMGADLTNGLLISTEKLNRLLEADKRERLVRVQAGMTLKELNTALSVNGLTVPIGGHDSDTIGGLISNCPSDPYAGKYGGIMSYVERLEVVLPNGDILQTNRYSARAISRKSKEKGLESTIYKKIYELLKKNKKIIDEVCKSNTGSAGYPTIGQVRRGNTMDLAPLFFGAQGTLGVISEVILRAVPIKNQVKRVVATFEDFDIAQKFLDLANSLKPKELNVYDVKIIKTAEASGKRLSEITKNLTKGYVVFAKFDDRTGGSLKKISSIKKVLPRSSELIVESQKTTAKLDEFENSLISFLNSTRTGERVPILTDFYMPAANLGNFINDLKVLEKSLKLDLALFGSYSASNYSLRPKFKVEEKDFNRNAVAFLRAGSYIINREGGSITGGMPEGRLKALVTNDELSAVEKKLYTVIKKIFDPKDIMNPAIKLGTDSRFTITHFRSTGSSKVVV
ncbi:FAD-binding oxidoreductase [Candidatus Saccharibacteria bacterium]|nr:FAD-binding oxidoreductase [Candidatus Saccharibacteria bacterium]